MPNRRDHTEELLTYLYSAAQVLRQREEALTADAQAQAVATAERITLERDYERWLRTYFPQYLSFSDNPGVPVAMAPHHHEFWRWMMALRRDTRPATFIGVWPRGGGKSTAVELGLTYIAALRLRTYALYICNRQDQANDHVATVSALLGERQYSDDYPAVAARSIGAYGEQRAWRRNRLWTASGFVVDALGLDSARRGAKLEEQRPDLIILDDIDHELDSTYTTDRKIKTLTRRILPAGARNLAVVGVQNLVHSNSIFAQLCSGKADWLQSRIISGPVPSLHDFEAQQDAAGVWKITAGVPTWEGQSREACQALMETIGYSSFRTECQHLVHEVPGGMFDHLEYRRCEWKDLPKMQRIVVWVDPAVTSKDSSDCQGIQADGLGVDGIVYRMYSFEAISTPERALGRAILKAVELGAQSVGVETDQGGDTWRGLYFSIWKQLIEAGAVPRGATMPRFKDAKAGAGYGPKVHRAAQMLAWYEQGKFVHVLGTSHTLESALRRFPRSKPFDLVDAAFWSSADLTGRLRIPDAAPVSMTRDNPWSGAGGPLGGGAGFNGGIGGSRWDADSESAEY